ncbi:type II secretion system minor pseudopilin GspH [Chitinimonas lacunae]|uniref:Type II secretion system protein H n=1 Tax=Chitinimonas lacunae TaxID=1963018 RepID=A0ABV8MPG3_9NEIS
MNPRRRGPAGFTLIEVLVVLVIVGVIVTLAAVRFGESDGSRLGREAERLAALLEVASDEAIASGTTLGWRPDGRGYRFWKRQGNTWLPLDDNETLRPRELPEGMLIDEVRVNLVPLADEERVAFAPSGVNAPFSLRLRGPGGERRLQADAVGRIEETASVAPAS